MSAAHEPTERSVEIGNRVRHLRRLHRMSIEQLSKLLDISQSFLGLVERGARSMSTAKLIQASEIFRVTLDYLVLGSGEPPANIAEEVPAEIRSALKPHELRVLTTFAQSLPILQYTEKETDVLSEGVNFLMSFLNKAVRLSGSG